MEIRLTTPLTTEQAKTLTAGDSVLITGVIYTARDAAHKRLVEAAQRGEKLPLDVKDAIIYYAGPTPANPGRAIGAVGPTTSYRMDAYAPTVLDRGLTGRIGTGKRSPAGVESMKKNGAVYFGAIGGAGALLSQQVEKAELIAYEDLGAEAIRKLTVVDFPAVVVIDCEGNNLYELGKAEYLKTQE